MTDNEEVSCLKFIKHIGGILNGFQINKNSDASARVVQKIC